MSQKRMFDRAIIDTDRFMDLPMSAKAIYFLLGMEADDEGFVSYKKIMRIHGGNEDDVKVLLAKDFLIMFDSGVVVITDWNSNNYLNANRIKPTEYQKEKEQIFLNENNKYKRISKTENLLNDVSAPTPSEEAKSFFVGGEIYQKLLDEFSKGNDKAIITNEFKKFAFYWTERNKTGTKQKWQMQETFDVKRRLYTWLSRSKDFQSNNNNKQGKIAFS